MIVIASIFIGAVSVILGTAYLISMISKRISQPYVTLPKQTYKLLPDPLDDNWKNIGYELFTWKKDLTLCQEYDGAFTHNVLKIYSRQGLERFIIKSRYFKQVSKNLEKLKYQQAIEATNNKLIKMISDE